MEFKTATSSARRIQIASNSVLTYRGSVAIDVFSSLIFTLSVTEIQLCKVNAHFPLDCTWSIIACNPCSIHCVPIWYSKCTHILHTCITHTPLYKCGNTHAIMLHRHTHNIQIHRHTNTHMTYTHKHTHTDTGIDTQVHMKYT